MVDRPEKTVKEGRMAKASTPTSNAPLMDLDSIILRAVGGNDEFVSEIHPCFLI